MCTRGIAFPPCAEDGGWSGHACNCWTECVDVVTTVLQALISQYAVPILEEQSVWGTDDETKTAYLDTQDAARMTLATLRSEAAINKSITLAGPQAYTIKEVRSLPGR